VPHVCRLMLSLSLSLFLSLSISLSSTRRRHRQSRIKSQREWRVCVHDFDWSSRYPLVSESLFASSVTIVKPMRERQRTIADDRRYGGPLRDGTTTTATTVTWNVQQHLSLARNHGCLVQGAYWPIFISVSLYIKNHVFETRFALTVNSCPGALTSATVPRSIVRLCVSIYARTHTPNCTWHVSLYMIHTMCIYVCAHGMICMVYMYMYMYI